MPGLFDNLFSDENSSQLALAAGLLGGRGSLNSIIGQSLMQGQAAAQSSADRKRQGAMDALQKQRFQLTLDEEARKKKQAEALEAFRASIQSPEMMASQAALSGGGGPTNANASMIPPVSQEAKLSYGAMKAGAMSPMDWLNSQRKDDSPISVPEGTALLDRRTLQPRFTNTKTEKPTSDIQNYQFAKTQGYPGTFEQWDMARKKAGATNLTVNADKGFSGAFGKNAADAFQASKESADNSHLSNDTIRSVRGALQRGGVILGPGAVQRQVGLRIGQVLGAGSDQSAESLANTKEVEQGLARIELEAAALIKGQGQVTEAERAIVRRTAAGEIQSLTPKELDIALKAIERNNNIRIERHQSTAKKLKNNPSLGSIGELAGDSPIAPDRSVDWNSLGR